jgi:regulator of sigma E protease
MALSFLTNIWWLLVLVGVMILVHELGHFWAARFFDVKVEVFSFGFGPRLFGFRRGETDYRFSLFFFGGYVKMAGEQPGENFIGSPLARATNEDGTQEIAPTEDSRNDPRAMFNKPRWQRLIILAAGPFMNVVLAVAVLVGLYMVVGHEQVLNPGGALIGHIVPDSPAAKAGIQVGDKIVRLDGKDNPDWEEISTQEIESAQRPMTITIERAGRQFPVTVTPVLDDKEGVGSAGWEGQNEIEVVSVSPGPADAAGLKKGDLLVKINGTPIHWRNTLQDTIRKSDGKPVTIEYVRGGAHHTVTISPVFKNPDTSARWMIGVQTEMKLDIRKTKLNFPAAVSQSLIENGKNASLIVEFLRGIIERRMSATNLSGPIRISQYAKQAAEEGPDAFLMLMSVVSLNLAIVNLLPIPILDGGAILTLLIETVMGRDLSLNVKEAMLKVGFVFLMMIMVFVIYNDIAKSFTPGLLVKASQTVLQKR